MNVKSQLKKILRRNGKVHFLSKLQPNVSILDVGCGNNSPYEIKGILPNCHYTGIDIGNYRQTKPVTADKYIITTPNDFSKEIFKLHRSFDAVISSHNLEHCDDRENTLEAILNALKKEGRLYLSFPSEDSVDFPSRKGGLNYYDDPTHNFSPPNFEQVVAALDRHRFRIEYHEKNYSPLILRSIGCALEPISKTMKRKMLGTWEYFGFESIIIATRT